MKMLPNSQATFWQETELPLMSSREAFHAKTLAAQESKLALGMAPAAVCGPSVSDWLASYDPNTQSLKTSQTCLVALLSGQVDGLAEFCQTWPASGSMQNGEIYRHGQWDYLMRESVSGLWPTPSKNDGRGFYRLSHRSAVLRSTGKPKRQLHWLHRAVLMQDRPGDWSANPRFSLSLMGFPTSWLD